MKVIYLLILSFLISGCIPKSPHTLSSYDLDIKVEDISRVKSNMILKIEYPKALGAIGGSRIYYKKDNITSYYLYSRWSSSLNSMLYKDLLVAMKSRYKEVVGYSSGAKANIALESEILDFYHIVNRQNSYAKITILVRLVNLDNKNIIKSKTFSYKKEIATPNANNFVKASKEALKEFLEELKSSF